MSEVNPPWAFHHWDGTTDFKHPASLFRQVVKLMTIGDEGIFSAVDLAVTPNGTPNNTSKVAAGYAVVTGDDSPSVQGSYFVFNDATVTKTHNVPGVGLSRIDILVARVRDSEYGIVVAGNDEWDIHIVEGTAAASPTPPAIGDTQMPIAQVTIDDSGTISSGDIVDLRPRLLMFDPPRCRVWRTSEQSGLTSNDPVIWTNVLQSDPTMWASGSKVYVPKDGWYAVEGGLTLKVPTVDNITNVHFRVNGSFSSAWGGQQQDYFDSSWGGGQEHKQSTTSHLNLDAGDYVELALGLALAGSHAVLNATMHLTWDAAKVL